APVDLVFDLARSIDLHIQSAGQTKEQAIAGVTSGLISKNETVTWRARHFGFWLTHKSLIEDMTVPTYFTDVMVSGSFRSFRHEHYFRESGTETIMEDVIRYEVPYGIVGKLFDRFILKKYLSNFIIRRNVVIKNAASGSNK